MCAKSTVVITMPLQQSPTMNRFAPVPACLAIPSGVINLPSRHSLLALGYAGWGPGQLDSEMQANAWLHAPADTDLIFGGDLDGKWGQAVAKLGVDVSLLSGEAGHA